MLPLGWLGYIIELAGFRVINHKMALGLVLR